MTKKKAKVAEVQEVAETPKIEPGFDESQLGSVQRDNLLRARKSSLPGFDCVNSGCGWPLRIGVGGNCIASAMTGTVNCPRCKLKQIDTTQTAAERQGARNAIMGKGTRVQVNRESRVDHPTFPNHRLFNQCPCSRCGNPLNNVTIIRGVEKAVRCSCGASSSNLRIIDLGTEVKNPQMLYDYFGPQAAVYQDQIEKQPEQEFVGFGNKGRVA